MIRLHTFGGNEELVDTLAKHGVRLLVVGGLAVHHHLPEREPDDLDLLVEQSGESARKVAAALIAVAVPPVFTEEQFVNARKVQISLKHQAFHADILTAGRDFDFDAHYLQGFDAIIGNTLVKVAAIPTLLALLADSSDAKHVADIAALRRVSKLHNYPCPCCGYIVFDEPPGSYAICPICFWEDDLTQLRFPTWAVGANRVSLADAQQNYQRSGASEARFLQHCRAPLPADKRDPSWRPIDPARDDTEPPSATASPADEAELYYWRDTDWRRPKQ